MDFFASQELARRNTRKLIGLLILTVICLTLAIYALVVGVFVVLGEKHLSQPDLWQRFYTLENLELFGLVLLGVVAVVGFGSLYKTSELRAGGSVVAHQVGGRRLQPNTRDLAERRLLNVVEEMALASGVPVPPVYVLDKEPGLNAFAAGHTIDDCIIGVNRGILEKLNRDELQGVIGHEFSHILNGDMRMSLRMIGLLHGILVIALIGYQVIRIIGNSSSRSSSKDKKGGLLVALLLLGAGLIAIGSIGLFFARLIKASISRQREYLADASSVQFTRNPGGIAGALKMIGVVAETSRVRQENAEMISHMFFANMTGSLLSNAFATHPPLVARIQKIEPGFAGEFSEYLRTRSTASVLEKEDKEKESAKAKRPFGMPGFGLGAGKLRGAAPAGMLFDPAVLVATIGEPTDEDMVYARYLMGRIPRVLQEAIRDLYLARCVVFAWLLDSRPEVRAVQLESIRQQETEATLSHTLSLAESIADVDVQYRLPMSEIIQGTLVGLSKKQYLVFRATVVSLIQADKEVNLFEFFLQHHLIGHLDRHFGRGLPHPTYYENLEPLQEECGVLLGVLAEFGHADSTKAEQAFQAALKYLPASFSAGQYTRGGWNYPKLAHAVKKLSHAAPAAKKQFLSAAAVSITYDHEISVNEAELYRALGESLDCPVPPIMALK